MSDHQSLVILVQNLLQSQNNKLRAENQKLLNIMTDTQLGQLSTAFINILRTSSDLDIKKFVLTHLRKSLSVADEIKYKKVWTSISPQNQTYIKQSLFDILHKETSMSVRMICADAIGEIAGTLMKLDKNSWPKFTECIFVFLNDSNAKNIASGLSILESFFNYCPEYFVSQLEQFIVIFRKAFLHQNNSVKSAGIKCFANYAFSLDKKRMSKLQVLVLPFYQVAYHLLVFDNGNSDGLDTIEEIIELEPHLFKKTFVQLNELMFRIVNIKNLESGIKKIGTESLIILAEKYPSLYRQNKNQLTTLIQMIFLYMIEIDTEISEQWKSPPEGFADKIEEGDDETITFGMTSIDRLISSVGEKEILPILSNTVQKLIGMEDWRYKYASLLALSQTGQYIEDAADIKLVVAMLLGFLSDSNPMIRYASCHALGQISDDLSPSFQKHYGNETFIKLAPLLKDPVPRVVSHAASALTNLVEGMDYKSIESYMPELMNALTELVVSGISLVKESAMTTIASLGQMAEKNFIPYFDKTSQVIFSIIQNHHGKEYKELLGLSIQAITAIGEVIGKDVFRPVAQPLIEYLINVQETKLEEVDPQRQYVLAGWQRICSAFGKDMAPYLPRILPHLLNIVETLIKERVKTLNDKFLDEDTKALDETEKINTYETEQTNAAITMLKVFINEIKELYIPYLERTTKILLILIQTTINDSIKNVALSCLPSIVKLLKQSNHQWTFLYTKNFLNILIKAASREYDTSIIEAELETMRKIFQLFDERFLTQQQLNIFSQALIKILLKSNERKADTKDLVNEQLQEEQKQLLQQEVVMQEEVQVAISQLIGQLFKTHKEMNIELVGYIIKNIFPKVFGPGLSHNIYKFGLFLIDDMIEFLGSDIVGSEIWVNFQSVFVEFCLNQNCIVRQAASYGLGIYAEKTPGELFRPFIENSLQCLMEAIQLPQGPDEQDKYYLHCRDNCISAFGKIIKAHGSLFDPKICLAAWLNYLPLKKDKGQALPQHDFLADIVNNNLSLLVSGETPEAAGILLKILQVFGDILETKYVNQNITDKIKTAMNTLKSHPLFISNYDSFWSKLKEHQAVRLTKIVTSQ